MRPAQCARADPVALTRRGSTWQAAWADDPNGQQRKLITVRIRGDRPAGLLAGEVGIDLVGLSEATARRRLRDEIAAAVRGRAKPGSLPSFLLQAVHGMGGVGKTQTVIEYAHRHSSAYDLVWWINTEQATLITSQLAALVEPLGLPTDLCPDAAVRAVCAERRRRAPALTDDHAELFGDLP